MKTKYLLSNGLFLVLILLSGAVAAAASSVSGTGLRKNVREIVVGDLSANSWLWRKYAPQQGVVMVEHPLDYELKFSKDGTLAIKADCNRASEKYTIDGSNISITIGPSTLRACPGESRGEQFLQLLGTAKSFVIAGDTLIIVLKDDISLALTAPSFVDRCSAKVLAPRSLIDTLDPKVSAELDKMLGAFVTPGVSSAPGASMLVITPTGKYFKSAGVADTATCSPLNADSPYQIGSNTKMMTAAIIYQLQEKGKLSTSDRISKYLPETAAKLANGREITIEMLLTHTSGLLDYFDVDTGKGGIADGMSNKSILVRGFSPVELVEMAARSGKSNFKPGEAGKWKYCNTGFILLGMIIEKVTGKSYEENLRTRIFGPLKLKKTYLQTARPKAGAIPVAYYGSPFTFTTDEWNASQGWSAGAVVSTSEDFAVFLKALFNGKLFKKKSTIDMMRSNPESSKNALGEGTVYGHGLLINHGVLGHGGQTLGFQSDGGYIPSKDVTIVIWANSATNMVNRLVVPELANIVTGSK